MQVRMTPGVISNLKQWLKDVYQDVLKAAHQLIVLKHIAEMEKNRS